MRRRPHNGGLALCGSATRRVVLVLAVMAVSAFPMKGTAQKRQLQLASTPWSPFTNAPGQARFAIDLVHAALERIGISADTTIVPDGALTPALLAGRFDGSAALWRDAERELKLLYSQPYLENRLVLVGRRGTDVSAATLAALPGKRVALVEGYSYGEAVEECQRTGVRRRAQRGGEPAEGARWRGRLHADGRARRPISSEELQRRSPGAAGAGLCGIARAAAPLCRAS